MKVLFVATVVSTHLKVFHIPYLKWFKEQGWEVHIAANIDDDMPFCDKKYNISIQRSPFKVANIKAYQQLKKIIEEEKYDLVHCHTPMGGILGRLCSRKQRKSGMKVLYTAHGFHFYKGAPVLNWLMYYPMEKICSYMTDGLITINQEDYTLAKKKMRAKNIYYIPGIGVDTKKFADTVIDREQKRAELGIPDNAVMLLSVGELIKRKNHEVIIRAVVKLNNPNIHYYIAGQGEIEKYLSELIKQFNLSDNVHLLGYRTDVAELYKSSDIFCLPSIHEGLPMALMEAMISGLPCVVSNIRGNTDLIEGGKSGFLCDSQNVNDFVTAINMLVRNENMKNIMGEYNKLAVQKFDLGNVMEEMEKIYKECVQ